MAYAQRNSKETLLVYPHHVDADECAASFPHRNFQQRTYTLNQCTLSSIHKYVLSGFEMLIYVYVHQSVNLDRATTHRTLTEKYLLK